MHRRNFLSLTGTFTGGLLVVPDFLHAMGSHRTSVVGDSCVVFIQLNGGNDGLNTFIPFDDPLYYEYRKNVGIPKSENVGYPEPNRSHFRSQEIWQTASGSQQYLNEGWLGRYLDMHYKEHHPTGAVNLDSIDNLALKGKEPNAITLKDPERFRS